MPVPMTIHVWDYLQEYEAERPDILAAVDRVMRSGRSILSESVRSFLVVRLSAGQPLDDRAKHTVGLMTARY